MKKIILSLVMLSLVLVLIVGCTEKKEEVPVEKSVSQEKIQVNVIVSNNVSESVLNSLKEKGLTVSLETGGNLVLTGDVNKTVFEELKNNSEISKVVEKKGEERGQLTAQEHEDAIQQLRRQENITIGPYIEQGVYEKFEKQKFVAVCIRFKLGYNEETYQKFIDEINNILTEDTPKIGGVSGSKIAFCTNMAKVDITNLELNQNILEITYYRELPKGVPLVLENGSE